MDQINKEQGQQALSENSKEWKVIEKLLMSAGQEQRKARRWGIFFKLLMFAYLFLVVLLFTPMLQESTETASEPHTAVVDVNGVIADGEEASAVMINTGLKAAFEDEFSKAIILNINSPGGSPVQSGYVYDEIKRLRGEHPDKKVYAVISDIGASGAYYIASAADEIYADKASLVGSIGVRAGNFGFVELIKKAGVERRVFTAGEHKSFLDPFLPLKEEEKKFWEELLLVTHNQFINQVKEGRGDRLSDDEKLFSGLVWTGEQALELGLIDGLGSASHVARSVIGEKTMFNYTPTANPFDRLVDRFAVTVGDTISQHLGLTDNLKMIY